MPPGFNFPDSPSDFGFDPAAIAALEEGAKNQEPGGRGGNPLPRPDDPTILPWTPPEPEFEMEPGAWQDEAIANWEGDIDPYRKSYLADAIGAGGELIGTAGDWVSTMQGSEGYTGAQDLRDSWQGVYDAGGLTHQTRSMLEQNRRNQEQFGRSQREADLANLAERGMTGGGQELAALLGTQSAAQDRLSQDDLNTAAFAEQQRLNALTEAGRASETIYGYDQNAANVTADAANTSTGLKLDASQYLDNLALDKIGEIHTQFNNENMLRTRPPEGTGAIETLGREGTSNDASALISNAGFGIDKPTVATPLNPYPTSTVAPTGPNAGAVVNDGIGIGIETAGQIWGQPKDEPDFAEDPDNPGIGGGGYVPSGPQGGY